MKVRIALLVTVLLLGTLAAGRPAGAFGDLMKDRSPGAAPPAPAGDPIAVEKAAGPDAYTVAEVYAKRADLDRKKVLVRGKVVKVSKNIMGKNWIHLRDGSGDGAKGTNNLVVTSQDLPSVGDVVTAGGTLFVDKDFGYGYKYAAIVEEASLAR